MPAPWGNGRRCWATAVSGARRSCAELSFLSLLEPQLTLWSPKTSILSCFAAVFGRFRAFEERYSSRLQCYCFDKTNVARYGSDVIDFGLCVTILCWLGAVFEPRTSR